MKRVKFIQKGNDIYLTCYNKTLSKNLGLLKGYYEIIPSVKNEARKIIYNIIKQ